MKIFYSEELTWEYDYIINTCLKHVKNLDIELFNIKNVNLLSDRKNIENNIFIITSNCYKLDNVINVVKNLNPVIIFHFSDEFGNHPDWIILQNYTKLLFRQHVHKNYNYAKNNIQIPLGYVTKFLSENIPIKKMSERTLNCSFVGSKKQDRMDMYNNFTNNMDKTHIVFTQNTWKLNTLEYSPQDIFNTYNNSIFVLVGRGQLKLDCFRIYEGILAGAIPVVVGSIDEINFTFNYNNDKPNLIYCRTWSDAVETCKKLLNDFENLQKIQESLLKWWNNQMNIIYKKIAEII